MLSSSLVRFSSVEVLGLEGRMDVNGDSGFVFERGCLSSLHNETSPANDEDQILVSDWDPLLPMEPEVSFHGSAGFPSYLVGLPGFQGVDGSGCGRSKSYTDMVGESLGLYETGQVRRGLCSSGFPWDRDDEKNIKRKKRKGILECESNVNKIQAAEAIGEENVSPKTAKSSSEKDENKAEGEENIGCQNHKPMGKNAKENPNNGYAEKLDYIHVRAKRGQATNSHSLAERVRREKISERMKLLQDLVPGCNKITGKAMMLDEIINYVQSLQRQVEFLSMKLAAINPDISSDIDQILSKDILHSQGGSVAAFGFSHGMSLPPHSFRGAPQSDQLMCNMPRIPAHSIPWMVQMPSQWERSSILHGVIPAGLIADAHADCKELNGTTKVEQ